MINSVKRLIEVNKYPYYIIPFVEKALDIVCNFLSTPLL